MRLIPLTQGQFAIVDDDDYDRACEFEWYCVSNKRTGKKYAARGVYDPSTQKVTRVWMHRFIKPHSLYDTDHENGDGLDNRKSNLRPCERMLNSRNTKVRKHSSQFKGVSWFKPQEMWRASIRVAGKFIYLGSFESEEDAARVYDDSAIKNFGEFALTNKQLGLLA